MGLQDKTNVDKLRGAEESTRMIQKPEPDPLRSIPRSGKCFDLSSICFKMLRDQEYSQELTISVEMRFFSVHM